jgi:hypothetical protein
MKHQEETIAVISEEANLSKRKESIMGVDDFSNEDAAPDQYEPDFDEDDGIDEDDNKADGDESLDW